MFLQTDFLEKTVIFFYILNMQENDISSSGYVIYTLEATLWCLFQTKTYKEAVLLAVNNPRLMFALQNQAGLV